MSTLRCVSAALRMVYFLSCLPAVVVMFVILGCDGFVFVACFKPRNFFKAVEGEIQRDRVESLYGLS